MTHPAVPPMRGTTSPTRLPLLDGLRGVAAIMVVLYHHAHGHVAGALLSHGFLAVDFFLLLSGFVLTRTFEPRFGRGLLAPTFMAQRLRRLHPLMLVGIAAGALIAGLNGQPGILPLLLLAVFYIPSIGPSIGQGEMFPLNGPQWSLGVELLLNALHASLLRHLPRLTLLAISAGCMMVVLRAGLHFGTLDLGWQWKTAWLGLVRGCGAYALGIVLARTFPAHQAANGAIWLAPMLLLPALILLPTQTADPMLALLLAWLVMLIGFPALLILALRSGCPQRPAILCDWLGRLSFPLYAVHVPFLHFGKWLIVQQPALAPLSPVLGLGLALGAASLLAATPLGAPRQKAARPARPAPSPDTPSPDTP